ncbi:MAG: DUF5996 family protein, partial [Thermomicrobiales bacterium]
QNHWWHVTLQVSANGLTTGPIPYGDQAFQIDFDFLRHLLIISTTSGTRVEQPLVPMTVAAFYQRFLDALSLLRIDVDMYPLPKEIPNPIPFDQDTTHASYDPDAMERCFQIICRSDSVFRSFDNDFLGKKSPVQFFWGAFDLAVTRFSGRSAPMHPGGMELLPDDVVREAYSHEVSSAGWWPGDDRLPEPAYFSYCYPEPEGFNKADIQPEGAYYHPALYEWILPYAIVREADDPEATLLAFLRSTYEAGATLGGWDRESLERR